jgi:hypothetical protein
VAMAATGGLAANGNLPDSVQDKIAHAAEKVGIDLPEAGDVEEEVTDLLEEDGETPDGDDAVNGNSSSADVHAAIDATEPGPERGKAVSEAARLKPEVAESEISTGSDVSAAVHEAIDSTEPGPERGKAVSEAASQNGGGDEGEDEEGEEEESIEEETASSQEGGAGSHGQGASKKNKP